MVHKTPVRCRERDMCVAAFELLVDSPNYDRMGGNAIHTIPSPGVWVSPLYVALAALMGIAMVVATWYSVVHTLIVPRGRIGLLGVVDRAVDRSYRQMGRMTSSYGQRDSLLATEPAVILLALLALWLCLFVVGYGLVLTPMCGSLGAGVRDAGDSLFTLGADAHLGGLGAGIQYVAAATGLVVVALQIAYLPTLYAAYNRRETEVTLLGVRAGEPAWGPELLARTRVGISHDDLPTFYAAWERWSADVAESHASYPALLRFRSPRAHSSWVVGLLAVLDSAALYHSVDPVSAPLEARLCLRMGFRCFQNLAILVGVDINRDPRPDDSITLTYEEFLEGYRHLEEVGFPLERSAEDAWPHFRGWRVNYEKAAYALARGIDAVPASWAGPRRISHPPIPLMRPLNRTPANPEGSRVVTPMSAPEPEPPMHDSPINPTPPVL